jgi:hypothetical protein
MIIIYSLSFICLILLLLIIITKNTVEEEDSYINYQSVREKDINMKALRECQVPTLNTEQCYKSREYECPIVNGSYLQCTNNYIPKPNEYNADCGNRTFDMVPKPWKISENCYYNKIKFNRDKKYGIKKNIE